MLIKIGDFDEVRLVLSDYFVFEIDSAILP